MLTYQNCLRNIIWWKALWWQWWILKFCKTQEYSEELATWTAELICCHQLWRSETSSYIFLVYDCILSGVLYVTCVAVWSMNLNVGKRIKSKMFVLCTFFVGFVILLIHVKITIKFSVFPKINTAGVRKLLI